MPTASSCRTLTAALLAVAVASASSTAKVDAKRSTLESRVEGLAVSGDLAALATSGGLVLMDVSSPAEPRRLGALPLPGGSSAVVLRDGRAYIACGAEGLVVADVSDPSSPSQLGRLDTDGAVLDVLPLDGGRVLVADGTMGLRVADLSNPAAPRLLASLDSGGYPRRLAPHPLGALVAAGHGGLLVVRLPPGEAPIVVGHLAGSESRAAASTGEGGTAFLGDGAHGLVMVDLSDPSAPRESARHVSGPGEVRDIAVIDPTTLALALGRGGLRIVEVRGERIRETGSLALDRPAVELALSGEILFVANDSGGLAAVDVGRPERPRLLTAPPGP